MSRRTLDWLLAFLDGSEHLDPACPATNTPGDVMWARLPRAGVTVATGRADRAVHERERQRITTLARIVDHLVAEPSCPSVPADRAGRKDRTGRQAVKAASPAAAALPGAASAAVTTSP